MKNKMHLNACFGLVLLGVGGLITFFTGVFIYQRRYYSMYGVEDFSFWDWRGEDLFFIILGLMHIVVGVALMMKAKWSHLGATFLAILSFFTWSYIIEDNFDFSSPRRPDFWAQLGIALPIYVLIFCGVLFLGNEKVKKELNESNEDIWDEEILDA